ncbi:MAG: hypothetical protein ACREOA_06295 [Candidatus Dormibacteria bacterium]
MSALCLGLCVALAASGSLRRVAPAQLSARPVTVTATPGATAGPSPSPSPPSSAAAPPETAGSDSQQCGGITDPLCYILDAFMSGPVALMGALDGSPDPAHISPSTGAITSGPWELVTTLVGSNPAVDNYDGAWGEPAHECGPAGCIPWVERLNSILEPLSISLLVLAFAIQVCLFMVGQQLNLRAGLVPCLIAAGVIGAGLPLHLAGRAIDAGTWASQALLQTTFEHLGDRSHQPTDLMTVLALTAYCPEDSPIVHPGIHLSEPGPSAAQQVLVQPWMDPHFTQSHCIAADDPDFTKEVLDRSENFFGPALHDANCDRGDAAPSQPLCTDTDDQVNNNSGQECLEGSGGSGLGEVQLAKLPLPGEPRAGNGQNPADCRYADIYWGTAPSFTDVWKGVGAHGRNGYDVPDGIQGMLAYTVLTGLALWLALTYLARYLALALLAGCASLAFLLLALPGGRSAFARYWRTLAELSAVLVLQTLVFLVFVAIVSTVSGLSPSPSAAHLGGCPLISTSASAGCDAGSSSLLAEVGSGNPGDQFAKCLLAIVTVWLMLELPKRLSRGELATRRSLHTLGAATAGAALGGVAVARGQVQPRAQRFGARIAPRGRSLLGRPSAQDHQRANQLEQGGTSPPGGWPEVRGRETRDQFIGRALLDGKASPRELRQRLGLGPSQMAALRERARQNPEVAAGLGRNYLAADGSRVHQLDAAYLNSLRRGRLRQRTGSEPPSRRGG